MSEGGREAVTDRLPEEVQDTGHAPAGHPGQGGDLLPAHYRGPTTVILYGPRTPTMNDDMTIYRRELARI